MGEENYLGTVKRSVQDYFDSPKYIEGTSARVSAANEVRHYRSRFMHFLAVARRCVAARCEVNEYSLWPARCSNETDFMSRAHAKALVPRVNGGLNSTVMPVPESTFGRDSLYASAGSAFSLEGTSTI